MKKVYLLFLLCCLSLTNFATTYYSIPAGGDPSVLASWSDNPAGGGTAPFTFANTTDSFVIQSPMLMLANTWTVYSPVSIIGSNYIWNNQPVPARMGPPAAGISLYFYGNLTMYDNSSISSNTGGGTSGGGYDYIYLYANFTMLGSSFFDNPPQYSYVYFANTSSSMASPQYLSATGGSQALTEWTYFAVDANVYVQLAGNFNTEIPSVSGGGAPTPFPFVVSGSLDCEGYSMVSGGGVTISAGGTLLTTNPLGINGSILTTGTSSLSGAGNYVFDGATAQVTGTLLPATLSAATAGGFGAVYSGSVTINNPAGVTLSQSTIFSVTGVRVGLTTTYYGSNLNLTSGNLTLGTSTLTMGSLSNITGTFSNTSMIITNSTGLLDKQFTANSSFLFPVGDNSGNYSPITLNVTGASYPALGGMTALAFMGVGVHNVTDPHNAYTNNYIKRYWNIVESGITSPSYGVTAQYVPGDVVGTESLISSGKYTGTLPWVKYTPANTTTHTLSATAVTNTSLDFSGLTTANPTFTITPGATICAGTPTLLTVLTSTADGSPTYTWAPSTGLSSTVGSSVTASPTATTTYTATVTDGNGFTGTATTTLTTNPAPGPLTSTPASTGTLCLGQTLALSDAVGLGTWSSTNTAAATVDGSGNVSTSAAGTTSIVYTIGGVCSVNFPINVVTAADPIIGNTSICEGGTTALIESGSGTWSSGSIALATVDPTSGSVSGIAAGNASITYTLAPGCIASTVVTVNALPATITGAANICLGSSVTLTETTPGGVWSSSNTAVATVSSTGVVRGLAAGTPSIAYTTSAGCNTFTTLSVVLPPPSITGAASVCAGLSAALGDPTPGGTWMSGNTALATVNPSTGAVYGVSPGTPTISYFIIPGCATSIPLVVNPGGTPTVSIAVTPGETLCPGSTATFTTATSTFAGPTPTFSWVKNGVTVATGASYHYVPANGDVVYNVLHSSFACASVASVNSAPITISVTPTVTPVVTISAVATTTGKGDDDTLVANVTSATLTPQYQWFKGGAAIAGATMSYYVLNTATTATGVSYNCVVSSGDACNTIGISNAVSITVTSVSVKQLAAAGSELKLAPNPNKGTFTINLATDNNEPLHVIITNILGEKVQEFTTTTNTDTQVSLNTAAGIYLLSATTGNGRYVARVVVN